MEPTVVGGVRWLYVPPIIPNFLEVLSGLRQAYNQHAVTPRYIAVSPWFFECYEDHCIASEKFTYADDYVPGGLMFHTLMFKGTKLIQSPIASCWVGMVFYDE